MDERPLKPDSSLTVGSIQDSLQLVVPKEKTSAKEWIGGVSIILAFSLALIFLFNFRSR
jgi:hypothetical protein